MEVDIPDLKDVAFVKTCTRCDGTKVTYDFVTVPKVERKRGESAHRQVELPCPACMGCGKSLTPVGHRLIDFLKSMGFHIPNEDGWRA